LHQESINENASTKITGYEDIDDLAAKISLTHYEKTYSFGGVRTLEHNVDDDLIIEHLEYIMNYRGSAEPLYSKPFMTNCINVNIKYKNGLQIERKEYKAQIIEPETPEYFRLNTLCKFLADLTLEEVQDKIRNCKLAEYEAGRWLIVASIMLAGAATVACFTYAVLHMLFYICCFTYAVLHMLFYICCFTYAVLHMLLP
jgi:hypothetical protein